jgi:hypothetical protein
LQYINENEASILLKITVGGSNENLIALCFELFYYLLHLRVRNKPVGLPCAERRTYGETN